MNDIHLMEANHQVTGHTILYCPLCGYRVQINDSTLEKTTLADGDKMTAKHSWAAGGGGFSVSGSKVRPEGDKPKPGRTCTI